MTKTIFNINGGLGREICYTGVLDKYHELHPEEEIIVISGNTDIFQNKPYIKKIYPLHSSYLYEDVILTADKYIETEPYNHIDYFKNKKHITQVLNNMINNIDEPINANINLNDGEITTTETFIKEFKEKHPEKKICLLQAYGASGGYKKQDPTNRSLTDNETEQVINILKEKNYHIYMVGHDESKGFPNTQLFKGLPLRQTIALMKYTDLIVTIDSFTNHVLGMYNKQGIVIWKATNIKNLGYDCNLNLECGTIKDVPNRLPHNIPNPEQTNVNNKLDIDKFKELLNKLK
jgi:hypothetical protein